MDYDIINQVYEEIIEIVNDYIRRKDCSYEVAKKLSFALLGYYLVMGPEIFEKINVVLDALNIYECTSEKEYNEKINRTTYNDGYDETICNPVTKWDYKFDENGKFLGGIPNIVYMRSQELSDVLSIDHEMSHILEGVSAKVENEDCKYVYIKQGFVNMLVNKENNRFRAEGKGFSELAAISLENRVVKELLKLDETKITSPLLKEFLNNINKYKSQRTMSRSYPELSAAFKDFIDNDKFYELMKKYYYEADEAGFKTEFEAFSPHLDYHSLKNGAEIMTSRRSNIKQIMLYRDAVLRQASIFSIVTGFEPEKKLLILV